MELQIEDDDLLIKAFDQAVAFDPTKESSRIGEKEHFECYKASFESRLVSTSLNKKDSDWKMNVSLLNQPFIKWNVGDFCRAHFKEDGLEYEAIIVNINYKNKNCIVEYIGYQNQEEQSLNALLKSFGEDAREEQRLQAIEDMKFDLDEAEVNEEIQKKSFKKDHIQVKKKKTNEEPKDIKQDQFLFQVNDSDEQSFNSTQTFNSNVPTQAKYIPPLPTQLAKHVQQLNENEALSTMLMSWYMSGYHTGYYEAIQKMKKDKNNK